MFLIFFNSISKRIKIQEPAWSHLIDFLKMRILEKKNHLTAIKIKRVMKHKRIPYIHGQDSKLVYAGMR